MPTAYPTSTHLPSSPQSTLTTPSPLSSLTFSPTSSNSPATPRAPHATMLPSTPTPTPGNPISPAFTYTPPTTSRYDPRYRTWKQRLTSATFIASFVGKDLPLEPVNYPNWPDGTPVAVRDLPGYIRKHQLEMPNCFCGLVSGHHHPAKFFVPRSAASRNFGRPSIACSTGQCSYWIDLEILVNKNPDLPRSVYPLRELPKDADTHIASLPKEEAASPSIRSSQDSEASRPQEASPGPSSQAPDLRPLSYGIGTLKHARSSSHDVFADDPTKSFQPELEAALKPMGTGDARSLVLKMFDGDCPGISMADFLHAVSQCAQCKLLTASSLLGTHHCPPSTYLRKGGDERDSKTPEPPIKHKQRRIVLAHPMSATTLALRKGAGATRRPLGKGKGRVTSPIIISSESEEI